MGDNRESEDIDMHSEQRSISEPPDRSHGTNRANPSATPSLIKGTGISPIYDQGALELVDRYIDEPRSLRVVVIGAGLAGITAACLFQAKVPGIQLTIFEKNEDVAGTWYENK